MENTEEVINNDDKLLALFSHLSIVIGGILVPIIIWAIKKNQSKFVRFHALQAIFYHIIYSVIAGFVIAILMIVFFGSMGFQFSSRYAHHDSPPVFLVIFMFILIGIVTLMILAAIAYGIYLAVKSYGGDKTKIPVIGKIIYERVYGNV